MFLSAKTGTVPERVGIDHNCLRHFVAGIGACGRGTDRMRDVKDQLQGREQASFQYRYRHSLEPANSVSHIRTVEPASALRAYENPQRLSVFRVRSGAMIRGNYLGERGEEDYNHRPVYPG